MKTTHQKLTALFMGVLMTVCCILMMVFPVLAADGDPEEPTKYIITYNYNHDGGKIFQEEVAISESGTTIATVTSEIPSRDDYLIFPYVFAGWSTDKTAKPNSASVLKPSQTFEITDDLTLYAVWGEYAWGETLTAAGDGSSWTYDGIKHEISGVKEEPDPDRTAIGGRNYSNGYFYQNLWYSVNVWRYTYIGNIKAGGVDVGSYTTDTTAPVYAEIWVPWPLDNDWTLVEDTYTPIKPATMKITPAPLTVTAEDQKVKYTGEAVTPEGTLDGLVIPTDKEQETATLNMDSFTEVGEHQMTYTIAWDGTAKETNYEVTEEDLGTLTIYYELAFDANGGQGAPETMEVTEDEVTLPSEEPTKENNKFLGWATSADAIEAECQAGDTIELSDNTTLYAVWEEIKYVLTYDANGGKEAPEAQEVAAGKEATVASDKPTREGYTFKGWAKAKDATKAEYQPGDSIEISEDTTLYAVWEEVKNPVTGDSSNILGIISLCGISFATIVALLMLRKRKHQ